MKLSEMNTEKFADVVCKIAEPASRIMNSSALIEKMKETRSLDKSKMSQIGYLMKIIAICAPVLLGELMDDVCIIIANLNDKTVEEVKAQPAAVTLNEIRNSVDGELMSFFR